MAEIKKTKTRMYDPWGYQEENNYESSENQFEIELNELFASATYDDSDKKIHFFNNDGKELSGSSIDTSLFATGVIKRAYYDPETKEIVIEFENGDVVKIDVHDLIDVYEFGNGLQIDGDGNVSILVDSSGEPYLSVSNSGIKISGVDQAITTAVAAEQARAEQAEAGLQAAIEAEEARATSAETALANEIDNVESALTEAINAEEARAKAAEQTLDAKIDQEIQDRKDDVDAEEARATAAEAAEKARAEAAEAAANRRIDSLNDAIDAEKTIREAADVALGRRIDQEIQDRIADVDAEEARATSAETGLQAAIEAEGQRAQDAETALDGKIDQEIANRQADVDAEEARATSAETEINERVDELIEDLQPLLNDTLVTTNEHEAAFGNYNISNTSEDASGRTIFSIGNGTDDANRSNALEVRENGDVYMWVENDYMQINRLLAMLAHEVYDDDDSSNNG